ncbi:MAG: 50S ribosomal protein L16 [Candidatus Portnoybacteria bacterium CG10_big_fil_rev_8_21_14_0_10_36_7]|uniref:Large ribosomal subunit protein uL16 n=1 Tax=Candidatus Portnoybacteria bacterium CG10_big_fil_rev_8_21_14_0_10_36_7 TaxID=1974812 RepID=A0A2M8KDF7_9BACT|nr:MAG: 50S ribosomal protein L16 [Candidatus Portnoybacteria bacterium CG10_big_fil_rev_8_21_14_0_10_36_7]
MLMPKKVKHRKWQKGRTRGVASRGFELAFGSCGLKAMQTAWVDGRQIESARRTITHSLKRGGKLWIRIFPDMPRTRKGQEVPMGGGKGAVEFYVAPVKPGRILFEIDGIGADEAKRALTLAARKMPMKTRIVTR